MNEIFNMVLRYFLFLFFCSARIYAARKPGFGSTQQNWGFVPINEKADMFWWLYYTTSTDDYVQKPLVIWLQGGPGGSSTGIGNFEEVGPMNSKQEQRDVHWIEHVNVLFVDNPVGTGFSYVKDSDTSYFAKDNTAIAQDFLVFLKGFLQENTEFQEVPIYIFGQSYGGKMAADIALLLHEESKVRNITCNLTGIALGDSWISPIDSLTSWPSYLYNLGFLDFDDFLQLKNMTEFIRKELSTGDYSRATLYFRATQYVINMLTTVDYYNVLSEQIKQNDLKHGDWFHSNLTRTDKNILRDIMPNDLFSNIINNKETKNLESDEDDVLSTLMNGPVRETLNITAIADHSDHQWGDQSDLVFEAVNLDFMKPVTEVIEKLLNETDIEISVYNGQLDLIVDTPGTLTWVNNLKWINKDQWVASNRTPIIVDKVYEGYEKRYDKFNFYWVHRAGHMVPTDNPRTMSYILKQIAHIGD